MEAAAHTSGSSPGSGPGYIDTWRGTPSPLLLPHSDGRCPPYWPPQWRLWLDLSLTSRPDIRKVYLASHTLAHGHTHTHTHTLSTIKLRVMKVYMESGKMVLMNLFQNSNGDASLEAPTVKNLPAMQETWVQSLRQEDPLEKEMATPLQAVFLPEESHGQRSLAG